MNGIKINKEQVRQNLVKRGRELDMQDLYNFLSDPNVPREDKLNTLQTIKEDRDWTRSIGDFGRFLNEQESLDMLKVPLLNIQQKRTPILMPKVYLRGTETQTPIILTSEPARQKYEENLLKLQKLEGQYQPQPPITERPVPQNKNFT